MTRHIITAESHILNESTINRLGSALLTMSDASSPILLDLSNVSFVEPVGIVHLTALLNSTLISESAIEIKCPTEENCLRYLWCSGFLAQAVSRKQTVVSNDFGYSRRSLGHSSATILPLTKLESLQGLDQALLGVEAYFKRTYLNSKSTRASSKIISTIRELCTNIFDHAVTDAGWIAAQRYGRSETHLACVQIAIADTGIGIRASLSKRRPDFDSFRDSDVLARLIEDKLSSQVGGGMGYQVLREAVESLRGMFHLRSGSGSYSRRYNISPQKITSPVRWPGTYLSIKLAID